MTTNAFVSPSLNLPRNISWQYDEATRLKSLIYQKQAFYDSNFSSFWNNWFNSVFDLTGTLNQFGLVVWCILLGVPVSIVYEPPSSTPPFGFGFGRENFRYSNFSGAADSSPLTTDEAQRLLRMRYYAQTISPSIYNINYALADVFGDLGVAYVVPDGSGVTDATFGFAPYQDNFLFANFNADSVVVNVVPMTQTYIFTFPISQALQDALTLHDILPRGSGVRSSIVVV